MSDFCADQFIYNIDYTNILGCVDLDAYVIGPREYELILIKNELTEENFIYFKKGYEKYAKLEEFKNEEIYNFLSQINDLIKKSSI